MFFVKTSGLNPYYQKAFDNWIDVLKRFLNGRPLSEAFADYNCGPGNEDIPRGIGLCDTEKIEIYTENGKEKELTLYKIFKNYPESSILWRSLHLILAQATKLQGKTPYFEKLQQVIVNHAQRTVNLTDLQEALFGKEKLEALKKSSPFVDDALFLLIRALGYTSTPLQSIIPNEVAHNAYSKFTKASELSDLLVKIHNDFDWLSKTKTQLDFFANYNENSTEQLCEFNPTDSTIPNRLEEIEGMVLHTLNNDPFFSLKRTLAFVRAVTNASYKCALANYRSAQIFSYLKSCDRTLIEYKNKLPSLSILELLQKETQNLKAWGDEKLSNNTHDDLFKPLPVTILNNSADNLNKDAAEKRWRQTSRRFKDLLEDYESKLAKLYDQQDRLSQEQKVQFFQRVIDETKAFLSSLPSVIFSKDFAASTIAEIDTTITILESQLANAKNIPQDKLQNSHRANLSQAIKEANELLLELKSRRTLIEEETLNNPDIPQTVAPDVIKISNDERLCSDGETEILFSLKNEDYTELLFDDSNEDDSTIKFYDYSVYHSLVDAAVDVKRQPIFSDYGDITVYPYFKPFKYQVDSVRTMLSRFEGRGIFADQVGLGKTPQALMTADVMFRCGTIRNAVIIASTSIIRQWRKEANTKFRRDDGSSIFELYPSEETRKDTFSFDELLKELEADKQTRRANALKVYFLSTDALKHPSTLEKIRKSIEAANFENDANAPFNPKTLYENNFCAISMSDECIEKENNIAKLYAIADKLLDEFDDAWHNDPIIDAYQLRHIYQDCYKILGKREKWDVTSKWEIKEHLQDALLGLQLKDGQYLVKSIENFNKKLEKIRTRICNIQNEVLSLQKLNLFNKERTIDLLIFDEVQTLLSNLSPDEASDRKKELFDAATNQQEFIARIQKKYCILISATPIRDDLSDIFNLLYMVDKNKLGDTKAEAEERFYKGHFGGHRSLSSMANDKDSKKKFQALNGLINSKFTRKRQYDDDVVESLRRQCATMEEIESANKFQRDDYGGKKFKKLVQALSLIFEEKYRNANHKEALFSYKDDLFKYHYPDDAVYNHDMSDELYYTYLEMIHECIEESIAIEIERRNLETRLDINFTRNICKEFLDSLEKLEIAEAEGKSLEERLDFKETCDLFCSYINRGLLDFYRNTPQYKTTFLADYIDWRRPIKHGIRINCQSEQEKFNIFSQILGVEEQRPTIEGFDKKSIDALQQGKVLFFEKNVKLRHDFYRAIRNATPPFGTQRKVYINLSDDAAVKHYTEEELLDLCYFGQKNPILRERSRLLHERLTRKQKNNQPLTFEEQRFLETWECDGRIKIAQEDADTLDTETRYKGLNTRWFSEFSVENGNWNAVYFMDKAQRAGTDLNAANILVIGQLDGSTEDLSGRQYQDPLDMEQLIGRISRTGQTEKCIVYTCLLNGRDKENGETQNNIDFNNIYYDILEDIEGFDLFGKCQTEVDFVVPVVMACLRRLFSPKFAYIPQDVQRSEFRQDSSEFKAVFKTKEARDYAKHSFDKIKKFPQMVAFAYENRDSLAVYHTTENGEREIINPIEAIKRHVRIYAKVLNHEQEQKTTGTSNE